MDVGIVFGPRSLDLNPHVETSTRLLFLVYSIVTHEPCTRAFRRSLFAERTRPLNVNRLNAFRVTREPGTIFPVIWVPNYSSDGSNRNNVAISHDRCSIPVRR